MIIRAPHLYYTIINIYLLLRQHTKKNIGFPFYLIELIGNFYLFYSIKLISNLSLFYLIKSIKVSPFLPIQYMNISIGQVQAKILCANKSWTIWQMSNLFCIKSQVSQIFLKNQILFPLVSQIKNFSFPQPLKD